jgi:hypothetical protein
MAESQVTDRPEDEEDGQVADVSDAAAYCADMARELAAIAKACNLLHLAYLFEMANDEASELAPSMPKAMH